MAQRVRIGDLDRFVDLQTRTSSQNSFGEDDATWSTVATLPAGVQDLSGSEVLAAEQIQAQRVRMFTIRYHELAAVDARLVYENENYNIVSVAEIGRRRFMELTAELVGDGIPN